MALTIDEIIAGINELAGDDKDKAKEVGNAIRERAKPVGQHLINVGSALKKEETKGEIERLKGEVATLTTERDEATAAATAANAAKPDVAKIEADLTSRWQKKVDDLKKQLATTNDSFKGALKKGVVAKMVSQWSTKHGLDPDYSQEVLAAKYGNNVEVQDDGSWVLKGVDGIPVDGATDEDRIAAFTGEVRKTVNPRFILTNADTGGGARSGGGGSSYDPVKVGTEMGKQERAAAAANDGLAFK